MTRRSLIVRRILLGMAMGLFAALATNGGTASAQYGSSFYYHNPRTGFTYSQGVGMGRHSAYGGFSVQTRNFSGGAYSGYRGPYYTNGIGYANRRYSYSQGAVFGPRLCRSGTAFSGR